MLPGQLADRRQGLAAAVLAHVASPRMALVLPLLCTRGATGELGAKVPSPGRDRPRLHRIADWLSHVRQRHRVCARLGDRPRLGSGPAQPTSEEATVTDLDRLEAAVGECRDMSCAEHPATKDVCAAVCEAKLSVERLVKDRVDA